MNIAQAAISCGKAKLKYSRASLLMFLCANAHNLHINRSTRKTLWHLQIWNFNRRKMVNRYTKLRLSSTVKWPSILSGNIRSIRNKLDEVKQVILQHNCDINVLTETWLNNTCNESVTSINNFKQFRLDREGKTGGGIVAYIRSSMEASIVSFHNPSRYEIMAFVYDSVHLFICIYHPFWNENRIHNDTIDLLFHIIATAHVQTQSHLYVTVLGDFNGLAPLMNNFCKAFNLKNTVTFNTRNENSIDCCFVSKQSLYHCKQLSPVGMSDHCLFKCINYKENRKPPSFAYIPDFNPSNRALFHQLMNDISLDCQDPITDSISLNLAFDTLLSKITSLFDYCFPKKKIKSNNNLPWVNNSIRHMIRKRDRAYQRGNITMFKHYRAKVKQSINHAKKRYCLSIQSLSNKSEWKKINSFLNLKKTTHSSSSNSLSPDALIDHFTSFKVNAQSTELDALPEMDSQITISNDDILQALSKCKKGGGVPFTPAWILNRFAHVLCIPLRKIFQASFELGIVPNSMKIAQITPIPKVKSPTSASDYRPITCTSPFLKILERIVMSKWLSPLITEHHFSDQFAFVPLPGRGCSSALSVIYGHCSSIFDKKENGTLLFVDFSKAFDRASPLCIINSLIKLGASFQCLQWIFNFLENRKVRVSFNGTCSQFKNLSIGTPQGSIISPVLFAILCHSLKPITSSCRFFKYADDLTILHRYNSIKEEADLQIEADNLLQWCLSNGMIINESKTKMMHLSTAAKGFKHTISINNTAIDCVDCFKLLGLTISSNLKWNSQVERSISSASKLFYSLVCLKRTKLSPSILYRIYCALVRPLLTYSCIVTINMPLQLKNKLLKTERRFCFLMDFNPSINVIEFTHSVAEKFVKSVKRYPHHPLRQLLVSVNTSSTRSERSLVAPHCRSSLMQKTILFHFK